MEEYDNIAALNTEGINFFSLDVVVYACNPSPWGTKVGGSCQFQATVLKY